MLNVSRLRVLAAVSTTGSVGAAATLLHYSQPAVSHHLKRLEAETGAQLVRRAGRGITLTAEGTLLAARAREILGRLDAADAELSAAVDGRAGRLRVAAFQSALGLLVPPAAVAVRAGRPELELQLTDTHRAAALQRLRDGEADVALVFGHDDEPPDDGFRYTPVLDDPVYLVSRQAGQLPADHRDSPWIAGCRHCRDDLVQLCAADGFRPRIAYDSEDIVTDQALVAAGLGVTTLPGLALHSFRNPAVRVTRIPGRYRRIRLVTVDSGPAPAVTATFVSAVLRAAAAYRDGPTGAVPARG